MAFQWVSVGIVVLLLYPNAYQEDYKRVKVIAIEEATIARTEARTDKVAVFFASMAAVFVSLRIPFNPPSNESSAAFVA